MFSGRHSLKKIDGKVFIDRDSDTFKLLITYMRNNFKSNPIIDLKRVELNEQLDYWGMAQFKIPGPNELRLIHVFSELPDKAHKFVQDKWKELGPFPLRNAIIENKLIFDEFIDISEK